MNTRSVISVEIVRIAHKNKVKRSCNLIAFITWTSHRDSNPWEGRSAICYATRVRPQTLNKNKLKTHIFSTRHLECWPFCTAWVSIALRWLGIYLHSLAASNRISARYPPALFVICSLEHVSRGHWDTEPTLLFLTQIISYRLHSQDQTFTVYIRNINTMHIPLTSLYVQTKSNVRSSSSRSKNFVSAMLVTLTKKQPLQPPKNPPKFFLLMKLPYPCN